jgi:NADH:ubiquinone reductase (H+-translocating)
VSLYSDLHRLIDKAEKEWYFMKLSPIVVVGGGYAGLHVIESIRKQWSTSKLPRPRIILLDKEPHHFKKVLLVRAAARDTSLTVPFTEFGWTDVEVIRGELASVDPDQSILMYREPEGSMVELPFGRLILALGSIVRSPGENRGGIVLRGTADAVAIREALREAVERARGSADPEEQSRLLHAVVAGAGISGIETASELAACLRKEASSLRIKQPPFVVTLVNAGNRLLPEASERVGHSLERRLRRLGVRVLHQRKVEMFVQPKGIVHLDNGDRVRAGVCVWTLGTVAQPAARQLGVPAHEDGRLLVDPWYRVQGHDTIFAIGDCARVSDRRSGRIDGMTCKEAIPQAQRLAEFIYADATGTGAVASLAHQGVPPMYCIGLGPDQGFIWARRWGMDMVLTGAIGKKVREYTWNTASFMK